MLNMSSMMAVFHGEELPSSMYDERKNPHGGRATDPSASALPVELVNTQIINQSNKDESREDKTGHLRQVMEEMLEDKDKIDEVEPDLEQTKMSGEMADDSQRDLDEIVDNQNQVH